MSVREARRKLSPRPPIPASLHLPAVPLPPGRKASPLVDPASVLSIDPSEAHRLRWMSRFRPLHFETEEEKVKRVARRKESLKTWNGHTERLLNSPQRFDVASQRVLPNALMVSLNFASRPASSVDASSSAESGTYVVPSNVLHKDWVGTENGMLAWAVCFRDALRDPRKCRGLYRRTRMPRSSPRLVDQIGSQLIRRAAQEIVLWEKASLARGEHADRPRPLDETALEALLKSNPFGSDSRSESRAVLVLSARHFESVRGPPPAGQAEASSLMTTLDDSTTCWNLEGLLAEMAKDPPSKPATSSTTPLVTAATSKAEYDASAEDASLSITLRRQILSSLARHASAASSSSMADPVGYSIPLRETTYPVILALRRCTWWLGEGWDPSSFPGLDELLKTAEGVRVGKAQRWEEWQKNRLRVEGHLDPKGRLMTPKRTRMAAVGQGRSEASIP